MKRCSALFPADGMQCQAEAGTNHEVHWGNPPYTEWPNDDYVAPPRTTRSSKASLTERLNGLKDRVPPKGSTPAPAIGEVKHFDGETYDPALDGIRLNAQAMRVWGVVRTGAWLTLAEIGAATGDPEASISARIRDLRKEEFGSFEIDRRRRGRPEDGIFEYRMTGRRVLPARESLESSSGSRPV